MPCIRFVLKYLTVPYMFYMPRYTFHVARSMFHVTRYTLLCPLEVPVTFISSHSNVPAVELLQK